MKTIVPDSIAPGLTDKQLECLNSLRDGDWHDHREISRELKNYIPANISGRMIRPLENRGIVEQEERTEKEGSKRKKKFVRIRRDFDEHTLHLLIEYSANDLVMKYREKNAERANFFLTIRNESIKKLLGLEKLEEERQQKDESEYWTQRFQEYNSEPWRKLIETERIVYNTLKHGCKNCCKTHGIRDEECYPLRRPGVSFTIATMLNKELCDEILQRQRDEDIAHGVQHVPLTGQSGVKRNGVDETP